MDKHKDHVGESCGTLCLDGQEYVILNPEEFPCFDEVDSTTIEDEGAPA